MAFRRPPASGDCRGTTSTDTFDPSGPTRAVGHQRDAGSTLVEIIVAVVLLAIVVVPVLGGLVAATRASAVARASSNVETALINAVDRVNRADAKTNQLCDYYPYARAAVVTQGWSDSEVSVVNEHLDLGAGSWATGGCPSGLYQVGTVQRVTITIRDPQGHVTRSIKVVKSDV